MKKAASIFSWIGGILRSIAIFVILGKGISIIQIVSLETKTTSIPYPWWVWILGLIAITMKIVILIYREFEAEEGDKIGCGICTLLFVSYIGGILTLLLPKEESDSEHIYTRNLEKEEPVYISKEQARQEIEIHENIYKKGIISEEEFEKRVSEIKSRVK